MIGLGRYNLLLKLGQGGMGAVFLARQKTLRRFCAVKIINPQMAQDREVAERFLREARATASLNHPHLVNVFDCDQFDGQYFIAMEYVEGLSLGQILRKHGGLSIPMALHWLRQATAGLEYVHGKNIIHRDIKPDNMIIDSSGNLKVMDLGLAKDHLETDQSMTMTGMVLGSPQYMSPEQINDSKTVDRRTDIYSLGITFYQMIVGKVPYQQTTSAAVCVAHLQQPMPSVNLQDAELTAALDGFICRMTEKGKEQRFQTAGEVLENLKPWMERYPLDPSSLEYFFNKLGFHEKTVGFLLQKEGIQDSELDKDLNLPLPEAGPEVTQAVEATAVPSPGKPASPPVMAQAANVSGKSWGWLKIGAVVLSCLLVLGIAGAIRKNFQKKMQEAKAAAAETVEEAVDAVETVEADAAEKTKEPGGLYVKTVPEGATVIFRNESKKSPATFEKVPSGSYSIKVIHPGYFEVEKDVEIEGGKFAEVQLEMNRLEGRVTVVSDPPGADILVDGESVGKTPHEVEGREGELFQCSLRLEGYHDRPLTAEFKHGGRMEKVKMEPLENKRGGGDGKRPGSRNRPVVDVEEILQKMPEMIREKLREIYTKLEEARAISPEEWDRSREVYLENFKENMRQKGVQNEDVLNEGASEIMQIVEQARADSEEDFEGQKGQYLRQMVDVLMRMNPPKNQMRGKGMGNRPGMKRPLPQGTGSGEEP